MKNDFKEGSFLVTVVSPYRFFYGNLDMVNGWLATTYDSLLVSFEEAGGGLQVLVGEVGGVVFGNLLVRGYRSKGGSQ